MKVAIVYDSNTGNTEKIAQSIKEVLNKDDLIYYGKVIDNLDADLYFIGTWVDKGNCSTKIQNFLSQLENKKISFFATAGFGASQEYFDNLAKRFDTFVAPSNQILGHFFCQGKMPMAVKDRYIKMIQEHPDDKRLQVSLENFDAALSHPDQNDIKNVQDYALKQLELFRAC
ncbi:flavodoxin family protein BilS [uncultured Thomasclavelia sp.]|uniref:flavodoxin family protein BilS n=1 Tax=uncultured Thomasclavelia sp. TaxID=3025759 RepID=UPI0025F29AC3|nr:flavodoxin family protein BilS [uncultured Thomasclavelia sp.]